MFCSFFSFVFVCAFFLILEPLCTCNVLLVFYVTVSEEFEEHSCLRTLVKKHNQNCLCSFVSKIATSPVRIFPSCHNSEPKWPAIETQICHCSILTPLYMLCSGLFWFHVLWVYYAGHARVHGNDRADSLAGKAEVTQGLQFGISDMVRNLSKHFGNGAKGTTQSVASRAEVCKSAGIGQT